MAQLGSLSTTTSCCPGPQGMAPFIVEAGLVSGNQASAVFHEVAELLALGVGERGDIGQDERLERAHVRGVEQTVVDHLEQCTGASLPRRIVVHLQGLRLAAGCEASDIL